MADLDGDDAGSSEAPATEGRMEKTMRHYRSCRRRKGEIFTGDTGPMDDGLSQAPRPEGMRLQLPPRITEEVQGLQSSPSQNVGMELPVRPAEAEMRGADLLHMPRKLYPTQPAEAKMSGDESRNGSDQISASLNRQPASVQMHAKMSNANEKSNYQSVPEPQQKARDRAVPHMQEKPRQDDTIDMPEQEVSGQRRRVCKVRFVPPADMASSLPDFSSMDFQGAVDLASSWSQQTLSQASQDVKQQMMDMMDLLISPLAPGPFQIATELEERHAKYRIDLDRSTRLWEFRLCLEMIKDCLESYVQDGDRDVLSSAEEVLSSVEELLRRVAELAFLHGLSDDAFLDSISGERISEGIISEGEDPATLLNVLRSPDFQQRGALTQCLLKSRLLISGLLEAVIGELTSWRSQPSDADLAIWREWDQTYELLARRAAEERKKQQPFGRQKSGSPWNCCGSAADTPSGQQRDGSDDNVNVTVTKCFDVRPPSCYPSCSSFAGPQEKLEDGLAQEAEG